MAPGLDYFETRWKPKSWNTRYRFIFIRKQVRCQDKLPIQLDLFRPTEYGYEFKVIVTNKRMNPRKVVAFHEGRYSDLCRQACPNVRFSMNAPVSAASGATLTAPTLAERADGQQVVIALSAPLTPGHPADPLVAAALADQIIPVVVENELIVRANLPAATRNVIHRLN